MIKARNAKVAIANMNLGGRVRILSGRVPILGGRIRILAGKVIINLDLEVKENVEVAVARIAAKVSQSFCKIQK